MVKPLQDKEQSISSVVSRLPSTVQEISTFFDKEEFVEKTRQQIEKDLSGLFLFKPEQKDDILSSFSEELVSILNQLTDNQLQQFCYRIDLSEQLMHELSLNKEDNYELAFHIIKREAQKVFLRTQFKS